MKNHSAESDLSKKSTLCARIRFWHQDNQKLIAEEGGLERLDSKILEELLQSEYKISMKMSRN